MTCLQVSKALEIAKSNADLTKASDEVLYGCACSDFKRVMCSLDSVAKFLRWQCVMLNGEIDFEELNNLAYVLTNRIRIV